jgi:hypothetical protein
MMVPPMNPFFLLMNLRSPKNPNNNISQLAIKNQKMGCIFSYSTWKKDNISPGSLFWYTINSAVESSIMGVDKAQSK